MKVSIRQAAKLSSKQNLKPNPPPERPVKYNNSPTLTKANFLLFITLYLAFMVTCIVLYRQENYMWYGIIQDETSEWGQGAITDFIAVPLTTPQNIPPT